MRSALRAILYALTAISTAFTLSCYPPLIHQEQIILQPGQDAVFTCIGNSSLSWNVTPEDGRVTIENTTENDGLFQSTLIITNVSYMDSKLYECFEQTDDTETLQPCANAKRLYVDDPQNPFAFKTENEHIVHTFVGEDFLIPCIATNPGSQVRLQLSLSGEDITDHQRVSYEQGKGFLITQAVLQDEKPYECQAFLPGSSPQDGVKSGDFHVIVDSKMISKATIEDADADGVVIGDTFTLTCKLDLEHNQNLHLVWTLPQASHQFDRITYAPSYREAVMVNLLTVRNATKQDQGIYRCGLPGLPDSEAETKVQILGPEKILRVHTAVREIQVSVGNVSKWIFEIKSFPQPKELIWRDAYGRNITNNETFNIYSNKRKTRAYLKILKTGLQHAGRYTFTLVNLGGASRTINLDLNVTGPPKVVKVETHRFDNTNHLPTDFYHLNTTYQTTCTALGSPPPHINWHFLPNQSEFHAQEPVQKPVLADLCRGSQSILTWKATVPGELVCSVVSDDSDDDSPGAFESNNIRIIDFPDSNTGGMTIFGHVDVPQSTKLNLTCASSKTIFPNDLAWFKNDTEILNSTYAIVSSYSTTWSIRRNLLIPRTEILRDTGLYVCRTLFGETVEAEAVVTILARKSPKFTSNTNLNSTTVSVKVGSEKLKLQCEAEGVPLPIVTWYKDGQPLPEIELFKSQFKLPNTPSIISILTSPDYHGNYSCIAQNDEGRAQGFLNVKIEGGDKGRFEVLGIIVGVMAFFIILLVVSMLVKHRKDRQTHDRKVYNLIKKFKEGNVGSINSTLPVSDQVDLLPYDVRWEFPRENLQIGKLLGHGAFGRVFQALAKNLTPKEEYTNVAVKSAIDNLDGSNLKALASELKIMIHLGQHVNILNILGACTQDLKTGELLVIVEYCEFGNLLQYMQQVKQSDKFIDLRHVITKEFNPYDTPASYHLNRWSSSLSSNTRRDSAGYRALDAATSNSTRHKPSVPSVIEHSDSQLHSVPISCCTDYSYVANDGSFGENEKPRLSETAYDNSAFVTTEDLICWSYQIACGMEYLTSRKVLHGDLAARNILLAKNNIIKICDFGLSRQLYKNMYKKKKKDELLPIKWMAIESILEGKFSPFSDVWSYGVVMWELFSLGKTPYPGQDLNDPKGKFYTELMSGTRMQEPDYTPLGLHELMLNCWNTDPLHRPSFTHILTILEKYMTDENLKYYHGLNEPYSKVTVEKMEGRPDYLQLMGNGECVDKDMTPEFLHPPTYQNARTNPQNSLGSNSPGKPSDRIRSKNPPLVNNDAYSSSTLFQGGHEETELTVFNSSAHTQNPAPQSVFINNGYVPNSFFDGSPEPISSVGPTVSSLEAKNLRFPSTQSTLDIPDKTIYESSSPPTHRAKLDSGVYSIESHRESPPSHSFTLPHTFPCDLALNIDNSIQNQEYFQIITPPIS